MMKYSLILLLFCLSLFSMKAQVLWSDYMYSQRKDKIQEILYADDNAIYYYNVKEPMNGYGFINRQSVLKSISKVSTDFTTIKEKELLFDKNYSLFDIGRFNNSFFMLASLGTEEDSKELSLITIDSGLNEIKVLPFDEIKDKNFEYHEPEYIYLDNQLVVLIERTYKAIKQDYKNDDHKELMLYYFDTNYKLVKKLFLNYDGYYETTNIDSITVVDNQIYFILKEFVEPDDPKEKNYFAYEPKYSYSIVKIEDNQLNKIYTLNTGYKYNQIAFAKSNTNNINIFYTILGNTGTTKYLLGVGAVVLDKTGNKIKNRNFAFSNDTKEKLSKKEFSLIYKEDKYISSNFNIEYISERTEGGYFMALEYNAEVIKTISPVGFSPFQKNIGSTQTQKVVEYFSYSNIVISFDDSLSMIGIAYLPKEQRAGIKSIVSSIYTSIDDNLYVYNSSTIKNGFLYIAQNKIQNIKEVDFVQTKVTPNLNVESKIIFNNENEKSIVHPIKSYIDGNTLFMYSANNPFSKFAELNPRVGIYKIE